MAVIINFKVDDRAVRRGLAEQRKDIGRDIRQVSREAGERQTLPTTRRMLKPSRAARYARVGSTTQGAYIQVYAPTRIRSIVGLLNYGGTLREPIFPVFARALKVAPGVYRGAVLRPRIYRRQQFIEKSIERTLPAFAAHMERDLTRRMQSRLTYAGAFG